ncbi:60S ribosome subunit biogenesis protein NIP7 [Enterospora canceri]|uniref:60S ribosome subunit biogenesis protein NIP7 n=1 Tax=Enterospora canceri TaxID=1081671 RepID=A0A1Y1S9I0_9MICR|nr:60S ribosome subunit biogenesis protein NIP7 [Enterospora canceri]
MRELKEEEREKVFKKLRIFVGDNLDAMLKENVLMLNQSRVFLSDRNLYKKCSQISKKQLISVGRVLGKFTKTDNFKITITGMQGMAKYGLHKVWLQDNGENNFLYGNNALKSHVGRVSENIPMNAGVFVYNKKDTPLGFGLMALCPTSYQKARSGDIVVLVQADTGEYIRQEEKLC